MVNVTMVVEQSAGYGATDHASSTKPKRTLNEVYETIGMGRFQYLSYTLVALEGYSDYAELTLITVMMPAIRCEWGLTSYFEAVITVSVFAGYAVCAGFFGKVGDVYGRKPVVLSATILLLISALLSATAPNKWVFLVGRTATGCCVGVKFSSIVCYATEYAESKYRAAGISVLMLACFVGCAAVNVLAYFLLNAIGWRWFILVVSIPIIPALVLTAALPESPRYLCVSGKVVELNKALGFMARVNDVKLEDDVEVVVHQNEELGSYSMLFNEANKRSVISLSVVYFAKIFLEFGLWIFLPLFFSSKYCGTGSVTPKHDCTMLTQEDLWKCSSIASSSLLVNLAFSHGFSSGVTSLLETCSPGAKYTAFGPVLELTDKEHVNLFQIHTVPGARFKIETHKIDTTFLIAYYPDPKLSTYSTCSKKASFKLFNTTLNKLI
eukprot:sb/3464806/